MFAGIAKEVGGLSEGKQQHRRHNRQTGGPLAVDPFYRIVESADRSCDQTEPDYARGEESDLSSEKSREQENVAIQGSATAGIEPTPWNPVDRGFHGASDKGAFIHVERVGPQKSGPAAGEERYAGRKKKRGFKLRSSRSTSEWNRAKPDKDGECCAREQIVNDGLREMEGESHLPRD